MSASTLVVKVAFPNFTSNGQMENVREFYSCWMWWVEVLVIGLKVEREKLLQMIVLFENGTRDTSVGNPPS